MTTNQQAPTVHLECSTDGNTWSPFRVGITTVTLANIGDKVYIRATSAGNIRFATSDLNYNRFVMTGKIAASGNMNTLLDQTGNATLASYCYYAIFRDCQSLISAPVLPSTTLASRCYEYMFKGCTALMTAPELPATTLANYCYCSMFSGCTSLTIAPALPATALVNWCYEGMFGSCKKLASMDVSFTAWNPTNATSMWVYGAGTEATGTKAFTCPSALPKTRGYNNIPSGWTIIEK